MHRRMHTLYIFLAMIAASESFMATPWLVKPDLRMREGCLLMSSTEMNTKFSEFSLSGRHSSPRNTQLFMNNPGYILDSFDPEADELDEELSNENLLRIVKSEIPDNEVNLLAWKCLGYKQVDGEWTSEDVFPNWRSKYPTPPDLIGEIIFVIIAIFESILKNPQQACCAITPTQLTGRCRKLISNWSPRFRSSTSR